MADRVVTAHVPEVLVREVDDLAERLDRPRGWIVKEALARFVELERRRDQLTKEALDDADAGRLVDHLDIERWASRLGSPRSPKRRQHRR